MTSASVEHPVIGLIEATCSHLLRFLDGGIDHLSGLAHTSFMKPSPERKIIMMKQESTALSDCTRCKLSKKRKNIVFGEGNPSAELLLIGEGPGEVEDKTGRPFVGPAGELLDKIIYAGY